MAANSYQKSNSTRLPDVRQERYVKARSEFYCALYHYNIDKKFLITDEILLERFPHLREQQVHYLKWTDKYVDCPYLFKTIYRMYHESRAEDFRPFLEKYTEADFLSGAQQRGLSVHEEAFYPTEQAKIKLVARVPKTDVVINHSSVSKINDDSDLVSETSWGVPESQTALTIYERSLSLFECVKVDIVVYAPPCSGKTTLINQLGNVDLADTDDLPQWHRLPSVVFTNMPHLITRGRRSIVIVPSRAIFLERCAKRGLPVRDDWYLDLLRYVSVATHLIESDEYLSNLPAIRSIILKPPD